MKKIALMMVLAFGGVVGSHAIAFESLTEISQKMIEEQRLADEAQEISYDYNYDMSTPQGFTVAGYEDEFEISGFRRRF